MGRIGVGSTTLAAVNPVPWGVSWHRAPNSPVGLDLGRISAMPQIQ